MNDYDQTPQDVYDAWRDHDERIKKAYNDSAANSLSKYGRRYPVSPEYYAFHYKFLVVRLEWTEREAKRMIYKAHPTPMVAKCKCGEFYVWSNWLLTTIGDDVVQAKADLPGLVTSQLKYFCSRSCQQDLQTEALAKLVSQKAYEKEIENRRLLADMAVDRSVKTEDDDLPF